VVSILTRKLRRDMMRSKAQFVAVALTVAVGVAIFGASYDAFLNLKASYTELYNRLNFADLTVNGYVAPEVAEAAAAVDGVAAIETRIERDVPVRINGSHKMLGRIVSVPPGSQPAVNGLMVLDGGYLGPEQPEAALVELHMADHFGLAPGDGFEILGPDGWRAVTVAGVVSSAEYVWPVRSRQDPFPLPDDFGVVFVSHDLAAAITGDVSRNSAAFAIPEEGARDAVAAIARERGAREVFTQEEQVSNELLHTDVDGFGEMAIMFPVLFLAGAGMATYILLTRLIAAQRPLIGTLMASGFRRRTVLRHYLTYGVVVGLGGAIPGAIGGVFLAQAITGLYTSAISVPITVNPVHWETPVAGILFGLAVGALAAAAPAFSASRLVPVDAMNAITPGATGGASVLERLLPPLRRLPGRWKLVLRGIERNRRRAVYTMLGIILALVLILVSWGMIDTITELLERQFGEIQREDAQVYLWSEAGPDALDRLRAVDGVASAEPAADLRVLMQSGDESYATRLVGFTPDTEMHGFRSLSGAPVALPSEGVLVGEAVSGLLGVEAGDEIALIFSQPDMTVTERIAGFVDEPLGTSAYVALPHLDALASNAGFEGTTAAAALLTYEPGIDRGALRSRLTELPEIAAFVDSRALYDMFRSFLGLFYAFVGIMLAFGGVMAFALIFNTMSVNIAERTVEMATLMAAGVDRRTLSRLITYENLILSALGVLPGLAIGYAVAYVFMASYSTDVFSFDLHMKPLTFVLSAAAIMVVALLSQWPGLRALGRVDIPSVVRERAL